MTITEISLPNDIADLCNETLKAHGFEIASSGTGMVDFTREGQMSARKEATLRKALADLVFIFEEHEVGDDDSDE